MAAKLSTKEGDAPIGMERDVGAGGENTTGPSSQAEASLSSRAPAGTVLARQQTNEVGERVFEVLRDFSNSGDDTQISLTSNLHDDLGIQRAHIVYVAAKLEEEFGIDITPSEAQNILLARDAVNTVLRKLAAQG
jgi:acyl carrier protein